MATEVILPKLGMNTEWATIVRWCRSEGDSVAVGDVLAEVETDKATIELEAEVAGTLRKLLVNEGQRVAVNQVVAVIGSADEDISELVQQATASSPAAPKHVEQVYQAWRERRAVADTRSAQISWRDQRPPASSERSATVDRRLDPEEIRARLARRGVLNPPKGPQLSRKRLVIYGAGLGARQLLEITRHHDDLQVVGLIDDEPTLSGTEIAGVRVLGGFSTLAELAARNEIDGVALSFHSAVRRKIHQRIVTELGLRILPLVDPRAILGMDVQIGDGALIEAGAIVGPGTVVGEGTIVDVGATVAHDCFLGPFSHLSPGCCLSGVVKLTENVLVGVGAALNSTITIGRNVIITPGAAVMNDVPDDVVVAGVPAKVIGQSRRGA